MAELGFELLLRFLWGWPVVLLFIDRQETSERFVRLSFYIVFGVSVCAALLLRASETPESSSYICLALLVLGNALYSFGVSRAFRVSGFIVQTFGPLLYLHSGGILGGINFLTSALLLGAVFMGQNLGHWYLRVPGMHIRELQRVVRILFVALALKGTEILVTLSYMALDSSLRYGIDEMGRPLGIDLSHTRNLQLLNPVQGFLAVRGDGYFGLGSFGYIVFASRILWGLLAPFILAILIKKTSDMRSTQSATGILYAVCVMVLVGEGTGIYLRWNLGWGL